MNIKIDTDTTSDLEQTIQKMTQLSRLPQIWVDLNSDQIVNGLAETLLRILDIDLIYIQFAETNKIDLIETLHSKHKPDANSYLSQIRSSLVSVIDNLTSNEVNTLLDPFQNGTLQVAVVRFMQDRGVIVAGAKQIGFPSKQDNLLLETAVNNVVAALKNHKVKLEHTDLIRTMAADRERLSDIFKGAPSFLCVLSGPDHIIERANDQYLQLVGYRDIIVKPVREALPEVVEQGFTALLDNVYQTGKPHSGTGTRVLLQHRPNKPVDIRYLDFVYQPLHDFDKNVTGILVQGIDSTEREQAEIALRGKDERLKLLIDNIKNYAVIVIGSEGDILEWYGEAERITGYTPEEAIEQKLNIIFTPEDIISRQPEKEMAIAMKDGKAEDKRWHLRKDGSRFFANGTMTPLYGQTGQLYGFSKVFRDETEQERDTEQRALLLAVARHILESPVVGSALSEQVFEMIREKLDADVLFNYKMASDNSLHLVAGVGIPDDFQKSSLRLEPGQAFCGLVANTRTAIAANTKRISSDPAGAFVYSMGIKTYACHPLLSRDGVVLGTFSVGSTQRESFTEGEIHFLQTVSDFMALAWDRHEAEQELARVTDASEKRWRLYETFLSNTPDLAYVFDLDHRFIYANDVLLKMWGRTWDEAIGKNCLELGYELWHAEMHGREIEQVKATKRSIQGEVPFAGTFGRRIYDYIFVPIFGPDGEVEAVAGTTRDVTERKQSEDELASLLNKEKRRADLLARVANTSRSLGALLSIDSITHILAEESRSIIGSRQAIISLMPNGKHQTINAISLSDDSIHDRAYWEQLATSSFYLEQMFANKTIRMAQQELMTYPLFKDFNIKDSSSILNLLAVPLVGHEGKSVGLIQLFNKYDGDFNADDEAILIQLAAIASASIENANLYERVREQDRRKDEFLATLAHELRNPLAPIRTGLTVLNMTQSPELLVKTKNIMERQIEHMVHLVDDLLDVSRITSGKIQLKTEQIDFHSILDAALEVSRPLIEKGRHNLSIKVSQDPLVINADSTRISQVISNLLNNAAKYTPEGGKVELSAEKQDNHLVIRIADNGVGLAPETLQLVFDLFAQVSSTINRAQGGLGIGLTLVKRLVQMHGGTIEARSEGLDKGSTFIVRLPLALVSSDNAEQDKTEKSSELRNAFLRVLIVDDNVDAADTLSILLTSSGHITQTAYNGPDALKAMQAFNPTLILLDIGLPGMSGYDVAQKLYSDNMMTDVTLIALTGWGSVEDRRRTKDAGFDYHLTKPVDIKELESLFAMIRSRRESDLEVQ